MNKAFEIGPRSEHIVLNGVDIHYLDWGGDGQPALLVHAASFCAQVWNALARSLSARYRVLAVDLRGHGDSGKDCIEFGWVKDGEDLASLIEALDLANILAIGHSWGGASLVVANSLVEGRIGRLVLAEPSILFQGWTQEGTTKSRAETTLRRRNVWDSVDQIIDRYKNRDTFRNWREDILSDYVLGGTQVREDGKLELKCSPDIEARIYRGNLGLDVWPFVSKLYPPTLLLMGSGEGRMSKDSSGISKFLELSSACEMKVGPGWTHFFPMEHPEEFEHEIWDFVDNGTSM